jgi:hypothetical protein
MGRKFTLSHHGTKLEQLLNRADEYDLLAKLSPDPEVRAQSALECRERAAKLGKTTHRSSAQIEGR